MSRSTPTPLQVAAAVALAAVALAAGLLATGPGSGAARAASPAAARADAAFARLERDHRARIGVLALDTGTGRSVAYRAGERFAFASTSKALLAGLVLRDASEAELDRRGSWRRRDLAPNSPITDDFVASGLPLRHLAAAALTHSDNTAANELFAFLGGPAGVERRLRALGDTTTELDRVEPALNSAVPGDVRDTTTPQALARDLRGFLLGDWLTSRRRASLRALMVTNTTGDRLVQAGVPRTWTVADKSGAASYGTRNDVAVAWRPDGRPVVIAVLTTTDRAGAEPDDALVAAATRRAITALGEEGLSRR